MTHLNLWPMPFVAVVFLAGGVVAVVLIALLSRRLNPFGADEGAQDTVFEVTKLVGGVTGFFLIFVLAQSMNHFRDAEVATAREAGNILQLDRALAGINDPAAGAARRALREYVGSVVAAEWPAMRHAGESEGTEGALAALQLAVGAVLEGDPATAQLRMLGKNLDDVEDDRTARLGAAESGVPGALWWTVGGLFLLLAASLFLLDAREHRFRFLTLHVSCLTLLASLLFMVDGPYRGNFSVSPKPLQRALVRMGTP